MSPTIHFSIKCQDEGQQTMQVEGEAIEPEAHNKQHGSFEHSYIIPVAPSDDEGTAAEQSAEPQNDVAMTENDTQPVQHGEGADLQATHEPLQASVCSSEEPCNNASRVQVNPTDRPVNVCVVDDPIETSRPKQSHKISRTEEVKRGCSTVRIPQHMHALYGAACDKLALPHHAALFGDSTKHPGCTPEPLESC